MSSESYPAYPAGSYVFIEPHEWDRDDRWREPDSAACYYEHDFKKSPTHETLQAAVKSAYTIAALNGERGYELGHSYDHDVLVIRPDEIIERWSVKIEIACAVRADPVSIFWPNDEVKGPRPE